MKVSERCSCGATFEAEEEEGRHYASRWLQEWRDGHKHEMPQPSYLPALPTWPTTPNFDPLRPFTVTGGTTTVGTHDNITAIYGEPA